MVLQKNLQKSRKWLLYAGAFTIPALCTLVALKLAGIAPFGDKSFLIWDMNIQYVDFYEYLRGVLLGENGLMYSFSKTLGGDTIGLFAYYLSSPFNLLLPLFPPDEMPLFVVVINCLKYGMCGLTCSIFISKRFESRSVFLLIVSVCYALMQYNVYYSSNIMWLDGVYMLPLVLLGVYRKVNEDKNVLLFVSVALAIVFNWYSGYMVCLFSVLYFIYETIIAEKYRFKGMTRTYAKRTGKYVVTMVLGVLASCVLFLPMVLSMSNSRESFNWRAFFPTLTFNPLRVFSGFFMTIVGKSPNFYMGILVLVFVAIYFFNKQIDPKEKKLSGVFLIGMILVCMIQTSDVIFSSMHKSASYPFRYLFCFELLMAVVATRSFLHLKEGIERKTIIKVACVIGLIGLVSVFAFKLDKQALLSLVFLAAFAAVLTRMLRSREKKAWSIGLCVCLLLTLGELTYNEQAIFAKTYHMPVAAFRDSTNQIRTLVEQIQKADDSTFYRMESTTNRLDKYYKAPPAVNTGMAFGYSGISHYSSTYDVNTDDLIDSLGYSRKGHLETDYNEPILLSDALLGVKYVISKTHPAGYEQVDGIPEVDGARVYRNPYYLPLGVAVADSVKNVEVSTNPFEYQNRLFSAMAGETVTCYKPVDSRFLKEQSKTTWTIDAASAGNNPVYAFVENRVAKESALTVNGTYHSQYFHRFSHNIFTVSDGKLSNPTFTLEGEQNENLDLPRDARIYYLDLQEVRRVADKLKDSGFNPTVFRDGKVDGVYTAKQNGLLMTTIPVEKGWTITVNGKQIDPITAMDSLIAIPVTEGQNTISMRFRSPGIILGPAISLSAVILLVIGELLKWRRRKMQ